MEDALTRLHRAIDYALLATVAGSPEQRGQLYSRLAQTLTTQGRHTSQDDISGLPNFEALRIVLPIIARSDDGQRSIHPVWNSPDFIAPAVAALAVFFGRVLDPEGRSRLALRVQRHPDALYGYRLDAFEAAPSRRTTGGDPAGEPMTEADWMHVSILLSGAALAFLKEIDLMRFAPLYLHRQAEGLAPEGQVDAAIRLRAQPGLYSGDKPVAAPA